MRGIGDVDDDHAAMNLPRAVGSVIGGALARPGELPAGAFVPSPCVCPTSSMLQRKPWAEAPPKRSARLVEP